MPNRLIRLIKQNRSPEDLGIQTTTTSSDNTNVNVNKPVELTVSPEIIRNVKRNNIRKQVNANQAYITDGDLVDRYRKKQDYYNQSYFGYGMFGRPTNYNPSTPEGRMAIDANFNYAKNNAAEFIGSVPVTFNVGKLRGLLPFVSSRKSIGQLSHVTPYTIGQGAEAIVVDNSPLTVAKIMQGNKGEILQRNAIPNALNNKFIGYIRDGRKRFPTFLQQKVKILTEKTFPKYLDKLDKAMQKKGFNRVNDPYVQYRAYTDGKVVIDDVAPGNVGVNIFGRPKLVDFNLQTVPQWLEQGFILKRGGVLKSIMFNK